MRNSLTLLAILGLLTGGCSSLVNKWSLRSKLDLMQGYGYKHSVAAIAIGPACNPLETAKTWAGERTAKLEAEGKDERWWIHKEDSPHPYEFAVVRDFGDERHAYVMAANVPPDDWEETHDKYWDPHTEWFTEITEDNPYEVGYLLAFDVPSGIQGDVLQSSVNDYVAPLVEYLFDECRTPA